MRDIGDGSISEDELFPVEKEVENPLPKSSTDAQAPHFVAQDSYINLVKGFAEIKVNTIIISPSSRWERTLSRHGVPRGGKGKISCFGSHLD